MPPSEGLSTVGQETKGNYDRRGDCGQEPCALPGEERRPWGPLRD